MINKKPRRTPRSAEAEIKSFRLEIAYQGTQYQGWQKQARIDGPETVQELLERAAREVIQKEKILIHGSGRTDSGVHARSQVAHLRAPVDLPASVLIRAINAHLPPDIRILKLEECDKNFHSQLDVTAKTYRYFLLNSRGSSPVHWPFLRPFVWFITFPLDLDSMKSALTHLEGEHDFRSFQNRGTPVESTVREILEAQLFVHKNGSAQNPPWMPPPDFPGQLLEIRLRGTGFLKQMVRAVVGTVVDVGRGRLKPGDLKEILAQKKRSAGGVTAPAHGLFLDNVEYGDH